MLKKLMTRNTFLALALLALPAVAAAQSYSYDEVGRLVRAAYAQGGGVAYHYDEQDNMTAAIPLSLLPPPAGVEVTRLSDTSARIIWEPSLVGEGYVIERREGELGVWKQIAVLDGPASSYVDETLEPGIEYSYRVSTLSSDGPSAPSKAATFSGPRRPSISQGGIINGASFDPSRPIAPGSIVSVFGQDLGIRLTESGIVTITQGAAQVPLPTELGDYSLLFGEFESPLFFVGGQALDGGIFGGQINAQVPWNVPLGQAQVRVAYRPEGEAEQISDPVPAPLAIVSPALFTFDFGPGRAAGLNIKTADGSQDVIDGSTPQPAGSVPNAQPAKLGEVVTLFANGLGPTNPAGITGDSSLDALRPVVIPVKVFVGDAEAQVLFAGLTPQFVALYQINIRIPFGAVPGDAVPVVIEQGGVTSRDDVTIAVRP
ncbi:MAG: fibronectin type III domain-containing protein [Acidobacteria bacterium]|nr:fibronectin type III domain-containing protein [Acidobacteriota bacterium]